MGHPEAARPRDVFADLLRDTRGLHRKHSGARDHWFDSLSWERKEETLFELEMLLKGLGCFGNPRNHPGPVRTTTAVAHDFRDELRIVRNALEQCLHLIRQLLGDKDRNAPFSRYLQSVLPEDSERSQLLREQLSQDSPEESLLLLRNSFTDFVEIADGLLQARHVTHHHYHGLLGTVTREIGRNTHFNPLVALEFRPEFDRIRNPEVLEALRIIGNEAAHRVVALAFLTLFRSLRYLALVDHYASSASTTRRAYILLAVFRSDVRALTGFLTRRAPDAIAEGIERDLLAVPVEVLRERHEELTSGIESLASLRGVLENLANRLRMEVRRPFERELPAPQMPAPDEALGPQLVVATASLRASIHHAIRTLCTEIQPGSAPPQLGSEEQSRRAASERLRRDIWMFSQILRGFLAKARAASGDPDQWASYASFRFVREFLAHFRNIGYQLVRTSDYDRLDRFIAALESLREADVLDPRRMHTAIEECAEFHRYLDDLFDKISQRAELQHVPFDRKDAAESLRLYLGAA